MEQMIKQIMSLAQHSLLALMRLKGGRIPNADMTAPVGVVRYALNSGSDSRISHTPKQESGYIRSHIIGNQTVKEEDERILEASTAT
jgi:hypothetical protein